MKPVELNCLGLKCPRPIVEAAKQAKRSLPGTIMKITADDKAFENDIRAWCDTTGATLVGIERSGDKVTATVKLNFKG